MKAQIKNLIETPVQPQPCKSCPFSGGMSPLGGQAISRYIQPLADMSSQHICHSSRSGDQRICRGGRNIQIKVAFTIGAISDATNEAFEAQQAAVAEYCQKKNRRLIAQGAPIEDLKISGRICSLLRENRITKISDLVACRLSDLKLIRNLGNLSHSEISTALSILGVSTDWDTRNCYAFRVRYLAYDAEDRHLRVTDDLTEYEWNTASQADRDAALTSMVSRLKGPSLAWLLYKD